MSKELGYSFIGILIIRAITLWVRMPDDSAQAKLANKSKTENVATASNKVTADRDLVVQTTHQYPEMSIFAKYDALANNDGYFFYAKGQDVYDEAVYRYNLKPFTMHTCHVVSTTVSIKSEDQDPQYFVFDDECPELTREYCPPINPHSSQQPEFIANQGCAYIRKLSDSAEYIISRNILDTKKHICFRRQTTYYIHHSIKDEPMSCMEYKASLEKKYDKTSQCQREKERNKLKGVAWTKKDQDSCMLPKQISRDEFNELTTLKIIEPTNRVSNIRYYRNLADFRQSAEQARHKWLSEK